MKKKNFYPIIIIIICVILCIVAVYLFTKNDKSPSNSTNSASDNSTNVDNLEIQSINIVSDEEIKNTVEEKLKEPVEKELSTFTTDLSFSSEGRLKNIEITSQKLNGTVIEPHKEFSFNDTTRSVY